MDSFPQCHIDSIPKEIIDKIIDEAADLFDDKKAKHHILGTISVTWKRMTPRAQDHLFKNITFYGNSGLNGWCDARQDRRTRKESGRFDVSDPVRAVKGITYIVLTGDGALGARARECLGEFTKVKKLTMIDHSSDGEQRLSESAVGKALKEALGDRIQFLRLTLFELDVNDFVSYLLFFKHLDHLEIDGISFKPGDLLQDQTFPKFKGVLRLNPMISTFREVIEMLTSIPTKMAYSHIILGSGVVTMKEVGGGDCLRPFLLKSQDTLEILDIPSESILSHIGCAQGLIAICLY